MKLTKIFALITVCMLLLTGCNNDKQYNKMMDEATQNISKQQYEQALGSLQGAIDSKHGDKEAISLYEQVEKLIQVIAKKDAKMYDQAISLCDEINGMDSESDIVKDAAKRIKNECISLKKESQNLSFKESIDKRIKEVTDFIDKEDYISAKTNLGYIIDDISEKEGYDIQLDKCKELLEECNNKLEEIAKKEEVSKDENKSDNDKTDSNKTDSNKDKENQDNDGKNDANSNNEGKDDNNSSNDSNGNIEEYHADFNDELKQQIANAGANYIEFYFEYGKDQGKSPKEFAEQAFEETENDTPLGKHKEEAREIFMEAFKKAFEATGNEYE